ncbi:GNAT family N-acetyltransferase [Brevibacillus sp. AG]|uniref:aminoglycoside 6'-N-acetyltransferase AAC(6')-35 n=1 Tax=Brevibacillus sp. AG TaxID=3020891 RepID=UPI0008539798|nr:aminoglycoside 6'-N-acetyltransferase AAC(6')-35 [Brevibacillus sp. AG]MDC0763292.1 GNAT family N-acetyltransferase [Brevibacillus sp. AG]
MIHAGDLKIRALSPDDAVHLVKWLSDERVLAYYEGRDRPHDESLVQQSFFPEDDSETRCLILYTDKPIGYAQFYPLDTLEKQLYGYVKDVVVYGMDQFIGEPAYWNSGIGTQLVTAILHYLHKEKRVQKVAIDPQAWNERALRCYEKCGFRKVKKLPLHEWHEGSMRDCWLMEWTSPADMTRD